MVNMVKPYGFTTWFSTVEIGANYMWFLRGFAKLVPREYMGEGLFAPPRVQFSIQEQLLRSIEKQFQGGLVFKARRLLYHSTLGRE